MSLCGFTMEPLTLAVRPPKGHCVSYFPISIIKHHHQGNLEKRAFNLAYCFRGSESMRVVWKNSQELTS